MNYYNSYLTKKHIISRKVPLLNLPTERSTTLLSLNRNKTLPSLLNTERSPRADFCKLFKNNQTSLVKKRQKNNNLLVLNKSSNPTTELGIKQCKSERNKDIKDQYKQYTKDKKLVKQLTTNEFRVLFSPKKKKIKNIEEVLYRLDSQNSQTQENIKLAKYLLNSRTQFEEEDLDKINTHFENSEDSPAKIKYFCKNIISFAKNLQDYMKCSIKTQQQKYVE